MNESVTNPPEASTWSRDGRLVVNFRWVEDRYTHQVSLASGQAHLDVFEADGEELNGAESPVYAELHAQGEILFLSGMSDDRHWSASVEPTDSGVLFDIACRAPSPIEHLASCYRTTDPEADRLWVNAIGEPLAANSASMPAAPAARVLVVDGQTLYLMADAPAEVAPPLTVRYRYRLEAAD